MALTDAGLTAMVADLIGESVTEFNNANAYLGVGDSNTAFSAAQTDLQAASNKLRKAMNATYPSRSGKVVTVQASYSTSEANFAWQEHALFNASSSGTMLNRKVESNGTKGNTEAWTFTVTLTFSNP